MRENKYFEEFGKPFLSSDVSWKIQRTNKEKTRGMAVPYLDARAISDRLDAVVGQYGWKDSYTMWHDCVMDGKEKSSQLCTISIYDTDLKEWIGKTDGAENTDFEAVKGGLSDAFKRAAVKWNIGRYLYSFEPVWVNLENQYGRAAIAETEKQRLNEIYNRKVAEIFGNAAKTEDKKQQGTPKSQTPVYEIKSIKVDKGENGARSALVLSHGNKNYRAFMNSSDDKLKTGTKLKNIKGETKKNSFGEYTLLSSYEIAA